MKGKPFQYSPLRMQAHCISRAGRHTPAKRKTSLLLATVPRPPSRPTLLSIVRGDRPHSDSAKDKQIRLHGTQLPARNRFCQNFLKFSLKFTWWRRKWADNPAPRGKLLSKFDTKICCGRSRAPESSNERDRKTAAEEPGGQGNLAQFAVKMHSNLTAGASADFQPGARRCDSLAAGRPPAHSTVQNLETVSALRPL